MSQSPLENLLLVFRCKSISPGLFSAREHALTFSEGALVTQHHGHPSTQISRKLVVLGYIVAGFGSFWLVLLVL